MPKIDVLVSGTFRSDQGAPLRGRLERPGSAVLLPILGRPLAGNAREPCRSTWWSRGRCGATASTRSTCASPRSCASAARATTSALDIFNVMNSDTILTYNQSFNPAATTGSQAWLAPTSVLTPRFVKIGAQIDF